VDLELLQCDPETADDEQDYGTDREGIPAPHFGHHQYVEALNTKLQRLPMSMRRVNKDSFIYFIYL
jgi:hypothetical protein